MTRLRFLTLVGAMILSPPSSAFVPIMPVTTTTANTNRARMMALQMTKPSSSLSEQGEEQQQTAAKQQEETQRQLGIDIGKQMDFLKSPEEKAELKAELTKIIDQAVANGITDLEKLREKWQRDLESGNALSKLEVKMNQNGRLATYRFNRKVDNLVDTFFNQTLASRQKTHELATQDVVRQRQEEREKERQKRKAAQGPKTESWAKTNDAWDKEWDDW